MIVVAQGNEAKRLQASALKLARRLQHFGHSVYGSSSGMKGDLDEVSNRKLMLQLEQSAIDGNGLYFCPRSLTAFGHYRGRNRSVEMYTRGTLVGIVQGEVSHSRSEVCHAHGARGRLRKRLYTSVCLTIDAICPDFAIITAVTFLVGAQESTLVQESADKTKFACFLWIEGGHKYVYSEGLEISVCTGGDLLACSDCDRLLPRSQRP